MVNDLNGNYQEWLKKAEEDELSARALVDAKKGSPSTICFLSQITRNASKRRYYGCKPVEDSLNTSLKSNTIFVMPTTLSF